MSITECDSKMTRQEFIQEYIKHYRDTEIKTGLISDGYHTFNGLYYHRAILFSVICNQNHEIAWKSKLHHDGKMYDGMFIVGIETPFGSVTYHYDLEPYWDYFKVKELDKAPSWDGYTPDEAITRLFRFGCDADG